MSVDDRHFRLYASFVYAASSTVYTIETGMSVFYVPLTALTAGPVSPQVSSVILNYPLYSIEFDSVSSKLYGVRVIGGSAQVYFFLA